MSLVKFTNWFISAEQEIEGESEKFKSFKEDYINKGYSEIEATERAGMDTLADNLWEWTIGQPKSIVKSKITEKIVKLLPDSVLNDYYVDQFLGQFDGWYDNYTNKEETVEIMGTFFYEGFTEIGSEGLDYNPWTPAGSPVGLYPRAFYPSGESDKLTIETGEENLAVTKGLLNRFSDIGLIDSIGTLQTPTETYSVQPGDDVWSIAQENGLTVQDMINANPWMETQNRISDDQSFILIKPGEELIIPVSAVTNSENIIGTTGENNLQTLKNEPNATDVANAIAELSTTIQNTYSNLKDRFSSDEIELKVQGTIISGGVEYDTNISENSFSLTDKTNQQGYVYSNNNDVEMLKGIIDNSEHNIDPNYFYKAYTPDEQYQLTSKDLLEGIATNSGTTFDDVINANGLTGKLVQGGKYVLTKIGDVIDIVTGADPVQVSATLGNSLSLITSTASHILTLRDFGERIIKTPDAASISQAISLLRNIPNFPVSEIITDIGEVYKQYSLLNLMSNKLTINDLGLFMEQNGWLPTRTFSSDSTAENLANLTFYLTTGDQLKIPGEDVLKTFLPDEVVNSKVFKGLEYSVKIDQFLDKNFKPWHELVHGNYEKIADVVIGKVKGATNSVIYFGKNVTSMVSSGLGSVVNSVSGGFSSAGNFITNAFSTFGQGDIVSSTVGAVGDFAGYLVGKTGVITSTMSAIGSIVSATKIGSVLSGAVNLAGYAAGGAISAASTVIGTTIGAVTGAATAVATTLWSFASAAVGFIAGLFGTPLVVDLGGNGINTISNEESEINFDIDNDNFKEKVGWVSNEEGTLVMDKDGNGLIEDASEVFGDDDGLYDNGFDKLAELDDNNDGLIDANDSQFGELQIWVDANEDAVTDPGELHSLAEYGIQSIELDYKNVFVENNGNYITQIASVNKTNGDKILIADVNYKILQNLSEYEGDYNLAPDIFELPWIRGTGDVRDLALLMSEDQSLKDLVTSMKNMTNAQDIYNNMDAVLAKWAEAGLNDKKAILEGFLGLTIKDIPGANEAINEAYLGLKDNMFSAFIAQIPLGEALGITYDFESHRLVYDEKTVYIDLANNYNDPNLTLAVDKMAKALSISMNIGDASSESLTGDELPNVIFGNNGNDTILGGLGEDVLLGGEGNDSLIGGSQDDILIGGADNDILNGGGGSDTYIFEKGYGQDVIAEYDYLMREDTLQFGKGIVLGDLILAKNYNTDVPYDDWVLDLVIKIKDTDDQIIIEDQLRTFSPKGIVENFYFEEDGTTYKNWDIEDLAGDYIQGIAGDDPLLSGTSQSDIINGQDGNDSISGGDGDDYISGGQGNDTLNGGDGDDVYIFNKNDGQDIIESENLFDDNIVRFGAGITVDDLIVTRSGNDLVVNFNDTSDQLTIKSFSFGIDYKYEFHFEEDGTSLTASEFTELAGIEGTSSDDSIEGTAGYDSIYGYEGNDTINAYAGNDRIDGGAGTDSMSGGAGNDIYYVDNAGDIISENAAEGTEYVYSSASYVLPDNVENLTLIGDDNIDATGNDLDNIIKGNIGNNNLEGGSGNDIYIYNLGGGNDTITDIAGIDKIKFGYNILLENLDFSQENNDLVIQVNENDKLTLKDWFTDSSYKIETIEFYGGTSINSTEIEDLVVNYNPTATLESGSGDEDGTITLDVLAGASDPDGDDLVIDSFTQPANGSVTNVENKLVYTPSPNFNGTDNFDYTISDGNGGTITKTVTLTINAVNDAPVATALTAAVDEDGSVTIDGLSGASDVEGDTLSVETGATANNGTVILDGDNLVYTPDADFNGTDTITYDISDGNGGITTNTVAVTINPVNDAPTALLESATLDQGNPVTLDVLAEAQDVDGDTLEIDLFTQGNNGVVSQVGDSLVYTPNEYFNGSDSFDYTISDGYGGTVTKTVALTVNPITNINGTDQADNIQGNVLDNVIDAGLGNDTITDNDGDDIYLFNQGDGWDTITDTAGNDRIVFGEGITINDIILTRDDYDRDSLNIQFWSGEKITIKDHYAANKIETLEFSDGSTYSLTDINDLAVIVGTGGDDWIEVSEDLTCNTFYGGQGNDVIIDETDTIDTYLFALGDGQDTIADMFGNPDKIQFGDGITINSLEFTRNINNPDDLNIKIKETIDQITIYKYYTGYEGNDTKIETIEFSDGSSLDIANMSNQVIVEGSPNDDYIDVSDAFNNTYIGNEGNDYLADAATSDDTYQFNAGDGADTVNDAAGTDKIHFESNDIKNTAVFYKDGDNLYIDYGVTAGDDLIVIQNQTSNTIERFELANGEYLTDTDVNQVIQDVIAYADANSITLASVDDVKNNTELMNIIAGAWHS